MRDAKPAFDEDDAPPPDDSAPAPGPRPAADDAPQAAAALPPGAQDSEPQAAPAPLVAPTTAGSPPPDLSQTAELLNGPLDIRSLALTGIFLMLAFGVLYFARPFFLPVVLAMLLNFLLSPAVRALKKRLRIPESVGAALVLAVLLGALGFGIYELSIPASSWMAKLPDISRQLQTKVRNLRKPVEKVSQAAQQVESMANMSGQSKTQQVEIKSPGFSSTLLSHTQETVVLLVEMLILLYFLLASGDLFLRKLIKVLPTLSDKVLAAQIASEIERNTSTYLFTITAIFFCLGTAQATALWLLGMPNPVLWGLMVMFLNYVPYMGAVVGTSVLAVVALLTFESLSHALLVVGVVIALYFVEGNLVTPTVLGRRLTLNTVVVFVGLIFWSWLWGIPGALLAVPLLATFKIFCDHIEPLRPIAEFLGD